MCAASCHTVAPESTPATGAQSADNAAPIILIGNPNVGKSVIFGRLTGRYVVVSNYPGTTVEVARGTLPDGTPILDTPGTDADADADDEDDQYDPYANYSDWGTKGD